MRYAQVQILVGRGIALLIGFALFAYPYFPVARVWAESSDAFAGYLSLIRWAGMTWLILACYPWRRLSSKVAWWPGNDPHNLYGLAAVVLAIVGAGSLIYGSIFPIVLVMSILGKPAWGSLAASGLFAGFGMWAIRASRRLQTLAVARDHASAA